MLNKYAYSFVAAMRILQEGHAQLSEDLAQNPKALAPSSVFGVDPKQAPSMCELGINIVETLARDLELVSTRNQIATCIRVMVLRRPLSEFLAEVRQLAVRIEEDLRLRDFLYISPDNMKYYASKYPFGEDVAEKFKAAQADIEAAGKCLAVGQGTACVMHLARAMEIAIKKLASRLKVKINPRDTWGGILGKMDGKIRQLPEDTQPRKTKKDRWSETRVHLAHLKDAWRDRPMHAKQDFTAARAKEVFEAVRVFMVHLVVL